MQKNLDLSNTSFPPLVKRLSYVQPLNLEEIEVLMRMHDNPRSIAENSVILRQGDAHKKCYIITKGWACRFNDLSDGCRQIINFYLPGDIISPFAIVMPKAVHSTSSITPLEVCEFDPEYLVELVVTQPKLGLLYGWMLGRDDAIVSEHVVRVGRRSAYKRTAHLLLELFHRLKIIGETEDNAFSMPISQHILADTLGLSLVHMNRTLRKLRMEKLIRVASNEITLLDTNKLIQLAEYQGYYLDQIKNLTTIINNIVDDAVQAASDDKGSQLASVMKLGA